MGKIPVLFFACILPAASAMAEEVPAYHSDYRPSPEVAPGVYGEMSAPATSKFKLTIGGFVQLDYAYNSTNLGNRGAEAPPNGAVPSKDIAGTGANSATFANQDQSIVTARASRIWLRGEGPAFLGAKTGVLIEGDFYGNESSSAESPMFRMRKAYATLDWETVQLLFGQNWDIFGPMVAATLDLKNGSDFGAPNIRVPQIKLTWKPRLDDDYSLDLIVGVQDPSQFGNSLSEATGSYGPGVNFAGEAKLVSTKLGTAPGFYGVVMKPLTAGFFGLYGAERAPSNANRPLDSWGYGLYAFVPVLASKDGKCRTGAVSFEGEAYMAANMQFNHATAAAVVGTPPRISSTFDPSGNQAPAKGFGYIAQLIYYPAQDLGFTVGYGSRNAYNYGSYAGIANFQKSSAELYVNVVYDINAAIRLASEYQNLNTQYGNVNGVPGAAATGSDSTVRFVAYYFF